MPLAYPRQQIETRSEPDLSRAAGAALSQHGGSRSWPDGRRRHEPRSLRCECSENSRVIRRGPDRAAAAGCGSSPPCIMVTSPTWPTVTRIFEAWFENIVDGTLVRASAGDPLAADAGLRARGRARHRARAGDGLLPRALQSVRAAGRGPAADSGAGLSSRPRAVRRHRPRDEGRADPGGVAVPDPAEHLQRRALDRSGAVRHRAHARPDDAADASASSCCRPPARKS